MILNYVVIRGRYQVKRTSTVMTNPDGVLRYQPIDIEIWMVYKVQNYKLQNYKHQD